MAFSGPQKQSSPSYTHPFSTALTAVAGARPNHWGSDLGGPRAKLFTVLSWDSWDFKSCLQRNDLIDIYWLVVLSILKNISQWEGLSHILWKIIQMFQTTNQMSVVPKVNHPDSVQQRNAQQGQQQIPRPRSEVGFTLWIFDVTGI